MHARDTRIVFEEKDHRYHIDGSCKGWISVTTLIHQLFKEFDPDRVAECVVSSRSYANGTSKYCGMTADQIKDEWSSTGKNARDLGTLMHNHIEEYYHDTSHRQFAEYPLFQKFVKDHPYLEPYRVEWRIFDEDAQVCGSVDMVYRDLRSANKFVVVDWKRSKTIRTSNSFEKGSHACTSLLEDCNMVHYSLQLEMYKYILTTKYGLEISECFFVVLHPDNVDYVKYPILDVSTNIKELMADKSNRTKIGA